MMVGIDTNILVRFVTRDEPVQYRAAKSLLSSFTPQAPGYITVPTLVELVWVLNKSCKVKRDEVARALIELLREGGLVFEQVEDVIDAVARFHVGRADFADYLIERLGRTAGCGCTMTFDRDAASCAGMRLLSEDRDHNPNDSPAPRSVSTPSTAKIAAAMA